jgi:hypothetical protein
MPSIILRYIFLNPNHWAINKKQRTTMHSTSNLISPLSFRNSLPYAMVLSEYCWLVLFNSTVVTLDRYFQRDSRIHIRIISFHLYLLSTNSLLALIMIVLGIILMNFTQRLGKHLVKKIVNTLCILLRYVFEKKTLCTSGNNLNVITKLYAALRVYANRKLRSNKVTFTLDFLWTFQWPRSLSNLRVIFNT